MVEAHPLRRAGAIACERIEDGAVLLHCTRGDYYELDPVGLLLWDSLDGRRGPCELAELVSRRFDTEAGAALGDVVRFLKELERAGLVEPNAGDR